MQNSQEKLEQLRVSRYKVACHLAATKHSQDLFRRLCQFQISVLLGRAETRSETMISDVGLLQSIIFVFKTKTFPNCYQRCHMICMSTRNYFQGQFTRKAQCTDKLVCVCVCCTSVDKLVYACVSVVHLVFFLIFKFFKYIRNIIQ